MRQPAVKAGAVQMGVVGEELRSKALIVALSPIATN